MGALILVLFIGLVLVYVIWRFTKSKASDHGIEVITKKSDLRNLEKEEIVSSDEKENIESEMVLPEGKKIEKLRSDDEQECIKLIAANPKDLNAFLRLSVYYLQRQKWSDAKEVLLEALKIEPDNDRVLNNLGVVWYKMKRYNNAVTAFEKSLQKNDNVAHRYANLGLSLSALGENGRAAELFSKAIAIDPEQKDYQDLLSEAKSLLV